MNMLRANVYAVRQQQTILIDDTSNNGGNYDRFQRSNSERYTGRT